MSTLTSSAGSIPEPSGARVTKMTSETATITGTAHPPIDQLPLDMFKDNTLHQSGPGRKTNRLWFRSGVWMPPGTTLAHRQVPRLRTVWDAFRDNLRACVRASRGRQRVCVCGVVTYGFVHSFSVTVCLAVYAVGGVCVCVCEERGRD